jgi:hypothetical protein
VTLLLRGRPPTTTDTKSRRDVVKIVQAAPSGSRTLDWWQRWLTDHWA